MVLDAEFFLTTAELAVALAGFGSLAALIGRHRSAEPAAVDAERLRGMLEHSLATMILAVLPLALTRFQLPETLVWSSCGALFFFVVPYLWWSQVRRVRQVPGYHASIAYRVGGRALNLSTMALLAAGLSGAIALIPAYGLGLVFELAIAGGMFLRVASSLMAGHGPPAV